MEFFRDGNAADHLATLEHERLPPCLGEVEGGDEAVVAAADDDDVFVSDG